jgi:hypothetical protein
MANAKTAARRKRASRDASAGQPPAAPTIMLSKHVEETFQSQTIHLSGHGYVNCKFENCTLVVTNTPHLLSGCRFVNCNWRLEYNILWGDPMTRSNIRRLLDLVDSVASGTPAPRALAG